MIVTICGAYRNAGDHLIGMRARALLARHVDPEIVTIDRATIGPEHYELFNKARAVILCGGPAYQRAIYPKVYPLEREKVTSPIVPMGLGWKSGVSQTPKRFKFEPQAVEFVKDIHSRIKVSSARDPLTVQVLNQNGIDNILMTGCPAWYDLDLFEQPYQFKENIGSLVLSMPAIMQPGVFELMEWLTRRFPDAKRTLSFHHGVIPSYTMKGFRMGRQFVAFAVAAKRRGWKIAGLANSLPKLRALYEKTDLHIGYRVHAHLFCLSRRISSILFCEDIRGVGQANALKTEVLKIEKDRIDHFQNAIEQHFETRGRSIEESVSVMRSTFPIMQDFLKTL